MPKRDDRRVSWLRRPSFIVKKAESEGEAGAGSMSGEYTEEELEEYRSVFALFDTDGSGAIGTDELGEAMRSMGMATTERELSQLISEVDADGNGEIDFEEFCACMKQMSEKKEGEEEIIRKCFSVFDQDKNGVISETEWKVVMSELGGFEHEFIGDLFREVDVARNGQIDYHEFAQLVRTYLLDEEEKERAARNSIAGSLNTSTTAFKT